METEEKKGFVLSKNKIIILAILIVIVFITIFVFATGNKKYKDLEESMLATTKSYVKNGKIDFTEQYYLTVSQMGMKNIYDCSKDSGVSIKKTNGVLKYEAYLICDSYKSESMKLTNGKYIELVGANPLIVENNTAFVDPGYKSNGYTVEKISTYKNSPGIYTISYFVYKNGERKEVVNRYVVVSNVASADAPVLTLNGDNNVVIKVGGSYSEPGYVAIDSDDGIITNKVIRNGTVNSNVVGEYEITYKVTNSKGLTTTKKRVVSVIDKDLDLYAQVTLSPELETKDRVIITLNIIGDSYSYVLTPNKNIYKDRIVEYEVRENDTYPFRIYDNKGNYTEKKVKVENIDRVPPTGSCTAISQGGWVTYNVSAHDASGIKGYSYYAGTSYTEYMNNTTFKYYMDYKMANVIIQDIAGNITKISCTTQKISTITSASIPTSQTIYVGEKYTIPVTIEPSTADRKEIYFDITAGNTYISLNNGEVTGLKAGTATVRMRVTDSSITKTMTITVKEKEIVNPNPGGNGGSNWQPDPSDNSEIASWCTKVAATFTMYHNGKVVQPGSYFTMKVGEQLRFTLYLTKECGTIKKLTRTSAGGQDDNPAIHWTNWFDAKSEPFVDRYNSSTFLATDHYDWIIIAKKSTNGQPIGLSQTATQSTSRFEEIKSMILINVTVVQ